MNESGKQLPNAKSIAVLSFINRSKSQDNEYFSDGMNDEIINALFHLKYSVGVFPVFPLKCLLKVDLELNPHS